MKILVVGSGGREHALVKALKRSSNLEKIWIWPGNDGILLDAEPVPVQRGQFSELAGWCLNQGVDLVVIGPEAELVAGLSDILREKNIKVFGPSRVASQLEGSKVFAKEFMKDFAVPTANAVVVKSVKETLSEAAAFTAPFVLKADGLAAGKGVFICSDLAELEDSAKKLFNEKILGSAGESALLEQFQPGEEVSVLVLTNGKDFVWLPVCRDHKRLGDDDKGPNTGGMGVVGPIEMPSSTRAAIEAEVIERSVRGLTARNYDFRGVLFIGIMLTPSGPKVLEYNVRFGDPETQVILPLLDGDWSGVFSSIAQGDLPTLKWRNESVACIVLAAEGYPQSPVSGVAISGLPTGSSNLDSQVQVLHAGTRKENDGFVTNGGRVLNVVSRARSLRDALDLSYKTISGINWPGMQYRRDIGRSVL